MTGRAIGHAAAATDDGAPTRLRRATLAHGRGAPVLDGVDVDLPAAAVTVIAGRNAAGKTTLLRALAGLLPPRAGEVVVLGHAHPARWPAARLAARVALVPQEPQVAAAFTVREVVELGRHVLPRDPARVDAAIARVGLADRAHTPWPILSGGGRRRTALARALAQVPADGLLLLDEPTAGLDLDGIRLLAALVREHAAGGGTAALVLHDVALAVALADHLVLLGDGGVVAQGPPGEAATIDRLEALFGVSFEVDAATGRPRPRLLDRPRDPAAT